VGFRSQRERPVRITPNSNLRSDAGRVTVTAYAVGEESFFDQNGNNRWDAGEPFEDLGYVYIDPIENRPLETNHIDSNGPWTNQRVQVVPFVGALPQVSACSRFMPGSTSIISAPSVPNSCDGSWGSAHVRRDITVVLSGNSPVLATAQDDEASAMTTSRSLGASCAATFDFFLQDVNGNPMPAGTTAAADTSSATDLSATVLGFPVPNTTVRGGTGGSVLIRGTLDTTTTPSTCTGSGTVFLNISAPAPAALTTTISLTVTP
jgi:hypothetical protein